MYFKIFSYIYFFNYHFTGCSQKYEDQNIDYRNYNTQKKSNLQKDI